MGCLQNFLEDSTMKRLIALYCVAFLLLALSACDKNAIEPKQQVTEQLRRLPLEVKFTGSLIIDGLTFTAKNETTMVLPEKYWPVDKWYTYEELVKLGFNVEGLNKPSEGPYWYFVLHSGSQIVIFKSTTCSNGPLFRLIDVSFPNNNCFTDVLIDPRTYLDWYPDPGALHTSYIFDYASGSLDCGFVNFWSPWSSLSNYGWNYGASGYDEGWTNKDGKITQLGILYETCNLPPNESIGVSQIIFRLTAI